MANHFPLRWESTRDKWWYVSPIDWGAANGHYDIVRELLRLDNNHLITLTSLRRIRRLEAVWDDDKQFHYVTKLRAKVARSLFHDCDCEDRENSLIAAGYGGWLLYTAAAAGDLDFAQEIIRRNTCLVFGQGEYGVADIFYAAARSKDPAVFWFLYDLALSKEEHVHRIFRAELLNRATHAAARGGNSFVLKALLRNCADVAALRDRRGCTVLHSAASRGHVEVINEILLFVDVVRERDDLGNTALHTAAYKGEFPAIEALIHADSSLIHAVNEEGNTFLHAAIAGFETHTFRKLNKQILMMNALMKWKVPGFENVVNAKNKEGRSPLHMAIAGSVPCELVQLLMSVPEIDVNSRDSRGMTPLDLLKQKPSSDSSENLIWEMISAGAIFSRQCAKKAIVSRLKLEAERASPGTSFAISDKEMFAELKILEGCTIESLLNKEEEISKEDPVAISENPRSNPPLQRLNMILPWKRSKLFKEMGESQVIPIPLRLRYSAPNKKSPISSRSSNQLTTIYREKATAGLIQSSATLLNQDKSRRNSFSELMEMRNSGMHSKIEIRTSNVGNVMPKHRRTKSQYLCCRDTGVQTPISRHKRSRSARAIISVC